MMDGDGGNYGSRTMSTANMMSARDGGMGGGAVMGGGMQ